MPTHLSVNACCQMRPDGQKLEGYRLLEALVNSCKRDGDEPEGFAASSIGFNEEGDGHNHCDDHDHSDDDQPAYKKGLSRTFTVGRRHFADDEPCDDHDHSDDEQPARSGLGRATTFAQIQETLTGHGTVVSGRAADIFKCNNGQCDDEQCDDKQCEEDEPVFELRESCEIWKAEIDARIPHPQKKWFTGEVQQPCTIDRCNTIAREHKAHHERVERVAARQAAQETPAWMGGVEWSKKAQKKKKPVKPKAKTVHIKAEIKPWAKQSRPNRDPVPVPEPGAVIAYASVISYCSFSRSICWVTRVSGCRA